MSTVPRYIPHYTVEDHAMWEGDWELWSGVPIAMTPSSFGTHGSAANRIGTALTNAIDQVGCDATVLTEVDWIVSNDTIYRPDISVVCGGPPERHIENTPAIAVEVLSKSTRERDLTFKRTSYAEQGVAWYLVLDPDARTMTALQLNANGVYSEATFKESLAIEICASCKLNVDVQRLFPTR